MYIAGQYIGTLLSPKTKMHVYNKEIFFIIIKTFINESAY